MPLWKIRRLKYLKPFFPKTLLGRSLLILILPVLMIQIISTFMFFDSHWDKMTSRLSYAIGGEIIMIAEAIQKTDDPLVIESILGTAERELGLLVTFSEGETLKDMQDSETSGVLWEPMIARSLRAELEQKIASPFTITVDYREKWVEVRLQLSNGVLNVSLPQRRLFSSSSYIFLIWVYGASITLLIVAVLFMRNQVKPIRRLAIAAERFGKGRDVKDFKIEGAKEVRQAGQAFLDMKTRIQRQMSQRTEMLAGVSHDLRTPLTRMKLQLAMLGDGPDIDAMKGDILDMERMIEGYLSFVRGEGEELPVMTDLPALLREAVVSLGRQGGKVELDLKGVDLHMPLRPLAFKRCIDNILANAAKYAGHVWVSLARSDDGRIDIIVEDDGPGIDPAHYEDVFRPFFRVDASRNSETGGVGLGLPIAMDIVHGHGGHIRLERSAGHGGLAVHVSLPI